MPKVSCTQELLGHFRKFDVNNSGVIQRRKLERLMLLLDPSFTKAQLNSLFDCFDREGSVDYNNFVAFVFQAPPNPTAGPSNNSSTAAKLTIVQITDVYILDNFPHLRTFLQKKRAENPNTISMLTGDFLAPYLLSSLDNGVGMMNMIVNTPIDYLTWGNHEADIPHQEVCKRVREYYESGGKWINSNMQSHEMMNLNEPYSIVEVPGPDGRIRKVGFIAVMTNDPSLYKKFKPPGAFNGAKVECPWETLKKYKEVLEKDEKCDLVIPLQHLYEDQDYKTCKDFDFPVILSGHDHHKVDKDVDGTRLLKPGADGHYAVVLDITWDNGGSAAPKLSWEFAKLTDYEADEELVQEMQESYSVLTRLQDTELTPIPDKFRPLSSVCSRGRVTSMGQFICATVRDAFNNDDDLNNDVDLCMIRGGHICGERDYGPDAFFSLETLKTVNTDNISVGLVEMPGSVLQEGIKSTRGSISRLFTQYDDGLVEDENNNITHVNGQPLDPKRMYRIATSPTTVMDTPVWKEYFNKVGKPHEEEFIPLDFVLMAHFARSIWKKLLKMCDPTGTGKARASLIDKDGDGILSREELLEGIRKIGHKVADEEFSLVDYIISVADQNDDGKITVEELQHDAKKYATKGRLSHIEIRKMHP